jgi:hypothetical protein
VLAAGVVSACATRAGAANAAEAVSTETDITPADINADRHEKRFIAGLR